MNPEHHYKEINRKAWNQKTEAHLASAFYDRKGIVQGKSSLHSIELSLLGDVKGKTILHLQCHFGLDTISLARMGAEVTGVDLSDAAIAQAEQITRETGTNARFICCDIYDLPAHLDQKFDLVFSTYGTIGWLPDLDQWAAVISRFLKPGGRFIFVEFHPVVWMFDDRFEQVAYPYFNRGPIVETESGTYADPQAAISQECVMWNHGLGEVVSSLLGRGLDLTSLEEFDYSPYDCFRHAVADAPCKYRIAHLGATIPMVYALTAKKRSGQ